MRHLAAGGGLGAGWCELHSLPLPGVWGWPQLQGLAGASGGSPGLGLPGPSSAVPAVIGLPAPNRRCLPGTYWVALICLCFLNQISPAALGSSRLGGAPAQECGERDSSLCSLPQILIHLSSGRLIVLPLSPSKFSLMALVEHREPTLPPAGRRLS